MLEVTLLHEMTHTRAGDTDDVLLYNFTPWRPSDQQQIALEAYSWVGITRLAKKKPYVDMREPGAPDNNADSVAYFALGTNILVPCCHRRNN
jgi:hypothetical protein